MNLVAPIITAIEQLIAFLLQLKQNGTLSDADLDTLVTDTNTETRALIKAALSTAPPPPPPAAAA